MKTIYEELEFANKKDRTGKFIHTKAFMPEPEESSDLPAIIITTKGTYDAYTEHEAPNKIVDYTLVIAPKQSQVIRKAIEIFDKSKQEYFIEA